MAYPRYSKDTRTLQAGDYYVAIKGESFDGHAFVQTALDKGAAKVVVEQAVSAAADQVIQVPNVLAYLVEAAQARIAELKPHIIAITGSVGKTSTRKAIVQVLSAAFKVVAPEGNLNTPLGLSLTILNGLVEPDTKLVLEMGARFVGDIDELCTYFRPDVSVVTNVHGVHLETFGSLENIAHEKGMLVEHLTEKGVACLNYDNPQVRQMATRNKGRTLFYSAENPAVDLPAALIPKPYALLGSHAIYTTLAAYSVGKALGMTHEQMLAPIATLKSEKGRLSKLPARNGATLIDDTYNASPAATLSALGVLKTEARGRKITFLGDMLELGEEEVPAHLQIAQEALAVADRAFFVGPRMQIALESLQKPEKATWFSTSAELAAALRNPAFLQIEPTDWLLVKGSQGMRMERVSEVLLDASLDPATVLVRQDKAWKGGS